MTTRPKEPIDIDLDRRQVRLQGRLLDIGGRAFDLLVLLARHPGSTVAPEALVAAAWPGRHVEASNLRVQINRLRRALGPDAVVNVPGRGYRLLAAVQWRAASAPVAEVDGRMARLLTDALRARAAQRGLGPQALAALVGRVAQDPAQPLAQARAELERAIDMAAQVLAGGPGRDASTGGAPEPALPDAPLVHHALQAAAEATRGGLLDHASSPLDDALAELERREQARATTLQRLRLQLLEAALQQELLRRDAGAVAARVAALVALEEPARAEAAWRAQEAHYLAEGRRRRTGLYFDIAAALAARRAASATTPAARADALLTQALALGQRGRMQAGPESLQGAADAAREALALQPRDADPRAWATAQQLRAEALHELGRRQSGREMLEEALACADRALEGFADGADPLACAAAHHTRAGALLWMGAREADSARLYAAEEALARSLEGRPPEHDLDAWARSRVLRGTVLSVLAGREAGTARRHEAIAHHREALARLHPQQQALEWGQLQNLLGIDLLMLAMVEDRGPHLRQAAQAFQTLLPQVQREDFPVIWANGHHNLGMVLGHLGTDEGDPGLLLQAIDAYRQALQENTAERQPLAHAAGQHEVATALMRLAQMRPPGDTQALQWLDEAEAAMRRALALRPRDRVPLEWGRSSSDLANVLLARAQLSGDAAPAHDALVAAEAALEVFAGGSEPERRDTAAAVVADVRAWLGARMGMAPDANSRPITPPS